eukprot:403368777
MDFNNSQTAQKCFSTNPLLKITKLLLIALLLQNIQHISCKQSQQNPLQSIQQQPIQNIKNLTNNLPNIAALIEGNLRQYNRKLQEQNNSTDNSTTDNTTNGSNSTINNGTSGHNDSSGNNDTSGKNDTSTDNETNVDPNQQDPKRSKLFQEYFKEWIRGVVIGSLIGFVLLLLLGIALRRKCVGCIKKHKKTLCFCWKFESVPVQDVEKDEKQEYLNITERFRKRFKYLTATKIIKKISNVSKVSNENTTINNVNSQQSVLGDSSRTKSQKTMEKSSKNLNKSKKSQSKDNSFHLKRQNDLKNTQEEPGCCCCIFKKQPNINQESSFNRLEVWGVQIAVKEYNKAQDKIEEKLKLQNNVHQGIGKIYLKGVQQHITNQPIHNEEGIEGLSPIQHNENQQHDSPNNYKNVIMEDKEAEEYPQLSSENEFQQQNNAFQMQKEQEERRQTIQIASNNQTLQVSSNITIKKRNQTFISPTPQSQ